MEIYKEKTEILKKMREFTTITDDADFDLHAELLKWTSDIMSNVSNKFETPDPAFQGAN